MPPRNMSRYFSYQKILAVAGISVKGLLPERVNCPFCENPTLAVYADPVTAGLTQWLFCRTCSFSGDTLEFLHKCYKSASFIETVDRGIREGLCSCAPTEVNAGEITDYVDKIIGVRKAALEHWKCLSQLILSKPLPPLVARAKRDHAWVGCNTGAQFRMGEIVGFAPRYLVNQLFGDRVLPPGRNFSTVMVMANQDLPGRICRLRLIGETDEVYYAYPPYGSDDSGLAMTDMLRFNEPVVYATDNAREAIMLHRRNFVCSELALPLITFNASTHGAWGHVLAEKFVLWSDKIGVELFKQAKRIPNSYIVEGWNVHNFRESLTELSARRILKMLDDSARPWQEVLVRWITRMKATEVEVRSILKMLELNDDEREHIIRACSPEEVGNIRSVLSGYTPSVNQMRTAFINNRLVVEREGSWYVTLKNGQYEQITNAPIKITRQIVDALAGEVRWDGFMVYEGDHVSFTGIPVRDLQRHPVDTLSEILARAGKGAMQMHPAWKRYIVQLAQMFSDPKIVQTDGVLGPDSKGDILFSKFILSDGVAIERPDAVLAKFGNIEIPVKRAAGVNDLPSKSRACWTLMAAAITYNWIAKMRGKPALPVFVLGSSGEVSTAVMDRFTASMDMPIVKKIDDPSLPVVTRMNYPYILSNIENKPSCGNYVTSVSIQNGLAISTHLPCLLIVDTERWETESSIPPVSDLMWFLAKIQMDDYALPDDGVLWHLIDRLCEFQEQYLGVSASVLEPLCGKVGMNGLLSSERAIDLAIYLYQRGKLEVGYTENLKRFLDSSAVPSGVEGILVDASSDLVYISRGHVMRVCESMKIPEINWEKVEADLSTRLSKGAYILRGGLVIPKAYFDQRAEWCRSALS
jgi:hypothetical protein